MNKKHVFAITLFVISNLFVSYYLLNNPSLFTNMFKIGFKPDVMTLSYLFSSLVMVFDIFFLIITGILSIVFLGRCFNRNFANN